MKLRDLTFFIVCGAFSLLCAVMATVRWWYGTRCLACYTDYGLHDHWVYCYKRKGHKEPHSFEVEA